MAEAALIEPGLAERVLARALAKGGDFAEVFCEQRSGFSLSIDESRIEGAMSAAESGAGVRVIDGDTTYFAHVDGLAEPDLERAADAVAAALRADSREPQPLAALNQPPGQQIDVRPEEVSAEEKSLLGLRTNCWKK